MVAFKVSENSAFKRWNGFKVSKNSAFKNPNILVEIPFDKLIDLIQENFIKLPRTYDEFVIWIERLRIIYINGQLKLTII
jgi:hypothetical protein